MSNKIISEIKEIFPIKKIIRLILGTFIVSFGLYNIHNQTNITEGGVLGLILLLNHWFGLKPSIASPILDLSCYIISAKNLGKRFLITSLFSTIVMALIFKILECFPRVIPDLSAYPLLASILGAIFIGVGVGIVIKNEGSCGGDDALALFISRITGWRISRSYMLTDFTVLLLSLSYIPFKRIIYSLITVTISSYIIDFIKSYKTKESTSK